MGLRVSMINGVSGVLGLIVRDLVKSEAAVSRLQKRMGALQKDLMIGGAVAGVGILGLTLFSKPLKEAEKLNLAVGRLRATAPNLGDGFIKDAIKFASAMNIYGMSLADKIDVFKDAFSVFNDIGRAKMAAPILSQMAVANRTLFGEQGGNDITKQLLPMLQVAELRGGINDPARLQAQLNWAEKAFVASGGMVNPLQLRNAMRTGGIPIRMMTDRAFYLEGEPLMQELGGFRFGTGANAIYNNLVQSRLMGARPIEELLKLGLVDRKNVEWTSIGTPRRIKPGALHGVDLLQTGQFIEWLQQYFLPGAAKVGITSSSDIVREIGAILTNSRGAALLSTAYLQMPAIQRAAGRVGNAADIAGAYKGAQGTLTGATANLAAQWSSLLQVAGSTVLPQAIRGLNMVSEGIKNLTRAAGKNPLITKYALDGIAGIFIALTVIGSGKIVLAISNFVGLTGALEGLAALALPAAPIVLLIAGAAALGVGLVELWRNWAFVQPRLLGFWEQFSVGVGHAVEDVLGLNSGSTQGAFASGSRFVPGGQSGFRGLTVQGNFLIDGRKAGTYLGNAMAGSTNQQNGIASFDHGMAPILPGNGSF